MNISGQWLIREPNGSRYLNDSDYLEFLYKNSHKLSLLKERDDLMKIQFLIWDFKEFKGHIAKLSPYHIKIDSEIKFLKRIKKLKPIKGFGKRSYEEILDALGAQPKDKEKIIVPKTDSEERYDKPYLYSYPNSSVGNEELGTGKNPKSLTWPFGSHLTKYLVFLLNFFFLLWCCVC